MFRTKKFFALAGCAFTLSGFALAGTPVAPIADASAATSISGSAFNSNGSRVPGASVLLWRAAPGGSWQRLGRVTTTTSVGRYFIGGLADGYWYSVEAYKVYGQCGISTAAYDGFSNSLYATGGARGANIVLSYIGSPC